jgi:voltage-dependent anion channel protein 2
MPIPTFLDVGKATKELLQGSRADGIFQYDQKLTITSKTSDGLTLTVTAAKKGDKLSPSIRAAYNACSHFSADATVTTSDKIHSNLTFPKLAPGLKVTTSILFPDVESAKVAVEYNNPYANVKTAVGLTSAPKLDAAATTGYKNWIVGGDVSYCSKSAAITKYSGVVAYHAGDYQVAATLLDKASTVKASLYHSFAPGKAWGAEITRQLSGSDTSLALGYSQKLASGNLFKAKVDNTGVAAFLYGTKLASGEKLEASVQIDATDLTKPVKTGLAVNIS